MEQAQPQPSGTHLSYKSDYAQPLYLMMVLKVPQEVIEDIDEVRKRFMWVGDKELAEENVR